MATWQTVGKSDEWYTPKYIFDAMAVRFDLDVSAPEDGPRYVPCAEYYCMEDDSLTADWSGFVWMNPPFGGRNEIEPWCDKFFAHGSGVALVPDQTSAGWYQRAAAKANALLLISGRVKFERPDGTVGKSPANGTTLFAVGEHGLEALENAAINGLGLLVRPVTVATATAPV